MAHAQTSQSFSVPSMMKDHDHIMQNGHSSFMSAPDFTYVPTQTSTPQPIQSRISPSKASKNQQLQAAPFPGYNGAAHSGVILRPGDKAQIYTAMYSGVKVYEMEVNGIACMRRRADGWLNATQILKVAGIDKGKRTKILEKEVLSGEHEKVQGGYGKYQGTWISYERGRNFCRQYGVEQGLLPLLEHDRGNDGIGVHETPTKEQAVAAQRKRLWNSSVDQKLAPLQSGTFFSSISPMSSVALSAMEKAARLNTPMTKSGSSLSMGRQAELMDTSMDSVYGTNEGLQQSDEPPRKKIRTDNGAADLSFDQSFTLDQIPAVDGSPVTLPPLPAPIDDETEEKRALLMDLFADQVLVDYSSHPALIQLNAADYDLPLDASANTALHWAATLARIPLLQLLLQKGANMWRGNAAGQSALISAVLVNNCSDNSCFPQLLEMLSPLIDVRDAQGRTILHHIAIACGIKGRAPSSKYYLEALLEYLVRNTTSKVIGRSSMTLMTFLSTIVNAQDKGGNTALNLVARIGNRSIIQQLLEIRADPSISNHKGVSARDFGVGADSEGFSGEVVSFSHPASQPRSTESQKDDLNKEGALEEQNEDVLASLKTLLDANMQNHRTILAQKTSQIDALTKEIQILSSQQAAETQLFTNLQQQVRLRDDRQKKIANLNRFITSSSTTNIAPTKQPIPLGTADHLLQSRIGILTHKSTSQYSPSSCALRKLNVEHLRPLYKAYRSNNATLTQENDNLKSRSLELERLYRRVISLCTAVAEEKIDEMLPGLVAAVESESAGVSISNHNTSNTSISANQNLSDVHQHTASNGMAGLGLGRVRGFLALVEGVGSGAAPSINATGTGVVQAVQNPFQSLSTLAGEHVFSGTSMLGNAGPVDITGSTALPVEMQGLGGGYVGTHGHNYSRASLGTAVGPPSGRKRSGTTMQAKSTAAAPNAVMVEAIR